MPVSVPVPVNVAALEAIPVPELVNVPVPVKLAAPDTIADPVADRVPVPDKEAAPVCINVTLHLSVRYLCTCSISAAESFVL